MLVSAGSWRPCILILAAYSHWLHTHTGCISHTGCIRILAAYSYWLYTHTHRQTVRSSHGGVNHTELAFSPNTQPTLYAVSMALLSLSRSRCSSNCCAFDLLMLFGSAGGNLNNSRFARSRSSEMSQAVSPAQLESIELCSDFTGSCRSHGCRDKESKRSKMLVPPH